ncbi:PEP-CTERM sorting domain-containing protein [Pontiellaceae bacterium B1224]|nr:PEP-CTERM sorting domain-containing protein [Pontiellaceae bacterium B1224]
MKICTKLHAMTLVGVVAGMFAHTASAAVIDINGYLATSTETDGEWGDNSARTDTSGTGASAEPGTNVPDPVFDDDGTVMLTFSANGQGWRTGYSSGSYDIGEEWNVRSSYSATTASNAIVQGGYYEITLDSTGNSSDLFSWDSVSVSLWRNGSGADTTFQLAVDANNDGFDVGDLVGTAATPAAGIGGATTISYSGASLADSVTTDSVRLYTWGNSSINGNIHIYDAVAEYTVVPEPATLGLVAAFGGGILFVRRRFMV